MISIVHLCGPKLYEWEGLSFEVSHSIGPWPLKKDGDPKERAGRGFYAKVHPFMQLPEAEREKFRVGGGCQFVHVPDPTPETFEAVREGLRVKS